MKKKYGKLAVLLAVILCLSGCGVSEGNVSKGASGSAQTVQNAEGERGVALEMASSDEAALKNGGGTDNVPGSQNGEMLPELEIHFIDVGQGDATLIKCGEQAILIDAGTEDKGTAIQNYLTKQGISRLDYLVLTHPDADHIGGAPVVITKFDIGTVIMSDFEKDNNTYRKLIQALDYKSLKWTATKPGDTYFFGDGSFVIAGPADSYDDPNNASVALLLSYGETKALFTGDAEEEAELAMLESGIDLSAHIYKAGHHGSRTSSGEKFLDTVAPEFAVISCEENNSYGHPHAQTLNRFRERGINVYRTDEQGSIVAVLDGTSVTWNSAPSDTWKAGEPGAGSTALNEKPVVPEEKPAEASPASGQAGQQDKVKQQEQQEQQAQSEDNAQVSYICNKNTKKFHYPNCSSVDDMSEKNKLEVTGSREEIMEQGYVPCKRCNP